MDNVDQILWNDLIKADRALKQRESILAGLSKKLKEQLRKKRKPRNYSVEFEFDPGVFSSQEKSFVVEDLTVFRPSTIKTSLRATGFRDAADPDSLVTITVPFNEPLIGRNFLFDYFWEIRDTGSDREWQSNPQPSVFLMSGLTLPKYLGSRAVLAEGSEVVFKITPIQSRTDGLGGLPGAPVIFDGAIVRYTLYLAMEGFEEYK